MIILIKITLGAELHIFISVSTIEKCFIFIQIDLWNLTLIDKITFSGNKNIKIIYEQTLARNYEENNNWSS